MSDRSFYLIVAVLLTAVTIMGFLLVQEHQGPSEIIQKTQQSASASSTPLASAAEPKKGKVLTNGKLEVSVDQRELKNLAK